MTNGTNQEETRRNKIANRTKKVILSQIMLISDVYIVIVIVGIKPNKYVCEEEPICWSRCTIAVKLVLTSVEYL